MMDTVEIPAFKGAITRSNITLVTSTDEAWLHTAYVAFMYNRVDTMGLWQPYAMNSVQRRLGHAQELIDKIVADETYQAPAIFTYSEAYFLRVLRRVSENILRPDQIAVNIITCFKADNGVPTILYNPVDEEGDFELPWPDGYFDWRGEELFS